MSKKCWEKASRSTCPNCWATWFSVRLRPFLASSECEELEMVQFDPICLHVSKKICHEARDKILSGFWRCCRSRIMRFKPDYVHPFMNIDVSVVPDSVLASERRHQVRSCFNNSFPQSQHSSYLLCSHEFRKMIHLPAKSTSPNKRMISFYSKC